MADRKISDLTALTTPASGDYLPIVDISEAAAASKNKRVTIQSLFQGIPVNVGIGTSSPATLLDISAAEGMARIGSGSGNNIFQAYTGSSALGMWAGGSPRFYSTGSMIFSVNSTVGTSAPTGYVDAMTIDSSGNVGIGTSSPSEKLHVSGTIIGDANDNYFGSYSSGSAYLDIGNLATSAAWIDARSTSLADVPLNIRSKGTGEIAFHGGFGEKVRIDSSGNVGIGTSSPTTLLDVNADTVRVRTARTPASASATGATGEICWDANYIYVCIATNTWKRTALSTW